MGMLRNRNHFVRVGSDGNMGVYDQRGNRFIRENIGSDGLSAQIVIIPSSTDNNDITIPPEHGAIGFLSDINRHTRITPQQDLVLNFASSGNVGHMNWDFQQPLGFRFITPVLNTFLTMTGNPDLRTGITASDASAITIFSTTGGGMRYKIDASILATAGSSATYTLSWTEGGAVRTVALTVTATGTLEFANFIIQPDAETNITAQITALTSSTVNVAAIVSVLG